MVDEMKDKIITFIKHFLYIGFLILSLFYIATFMIVMFSFDSSLLLDIFGTGLIYFFIAIPIILAIYSLYLKYKRKFSFTKTIMYSVISILIYIFVVIGTHMVAEYQFKSFSLEKWTTYPYQRYRMLDDMTSKYNFIGMSRENVMEILGNPDFTHIQDSDGKIEYIIKSAFLDQQFVRFSIDDEVVKDAHICWDDVKGHNLDESLY